MRVGGLLVVVVALAGCSAGPDDPVEPPGPVAPDPVRFEFTAQDCSNAVLVRLVPFEATDPWLPPGFHPRDAQHFVGAQVATNMGAAVLAVTRCAATSTGDPFEVAFAGVFVEPVEVPGVDGADLEFYEVQRLGPRDAVNEALLAWGWPVVEATLDVTSPAPAPLGGGAAGRITATVADAAGPLYAFEGAVGAPFPEPSDGIRLWHASPRGVGYAQYSMPISPDFGPGTCAMRPGSLFADLGGTEDCVRQSAQVATYAGLAFEFRVETFPGVVL